MIPVSTISHHLSSVTTPENDVVPLAQRLHNVANNNSPPPSSGEDNPLLPALLTQLHKIPLPNPDSPEDEKNYIAAIADCIRRFISPESGESAFITLEEQVAIIQEALKQTEGDPLLNESLTAVLLGTANLQVEITKWMQDIIMSGGVSKEFEDW